MRIGSINGAIGKIILMVFGLSLLVSSGASADLFLKFDGIDGESTEIHHVNWSNILDVNWGVSATPPAPGGGGSGASKPVFKDLSWNQVMDKSVIGLFNDISTGKFIKNALVDFTTSGSNPVTYFQMEFQDVFLTNLDIAGTSSSRATIDGAFAYDFIKMTYSLFDTTGKKVGESTASYDLKTNTGSVGALAALFGLGTSGPPNIAPVPIPSSLLLLGSGMVGLMGMRRKFNS
jgi:type VI secretion system secreted protein Hcp